MLEVSNIQQYFKSGRGVTFQFYITDEELQRILSEKLPKEYEPYSLICYKYEGDAAYLFREKPMADFIGTRSKDYERFYLRSCKLTPKIEVPADPVKSSERRAALQKYYLYNGFIDIQHGFKLQHKFFSESSIGLIEKYYLKSDPDNLLINEGYASVFNALKKGIKKVLKFKSKQTWQDGRINVSKSNNVSEGFAEAVKEGKLITDIEVV